MKESNRKTVQAGWMIDGTGTPAQEDIVLDLKGETVSSVKKNKPGTKLPASSIDLSDHTVLPGLFDSHTHLTISGSIDPEIRNVQITDDYYHAKQRIEKHIRDYLRFGVIAVRDGGDFHAHTLRYKTEGEKALKVYAAGNGWHRKGRYGQLLGEYLEPGNELAQEIKDKLSPGIDHIKIVNSGLNSLNSFGKETDPQFNTSELQKAVDTGNKLGLKIMVHANGYEPVKIALEAGCHSIEHGFFMGDENLGKMAETGTVWVPTIYTMKAYMEYLSDDISKRDVAERNLSHQLEQVRKAVGYGVKIALGTDSGSSGVFHGFSVVEELKLLMEAGLSLERSIQSATSNASKLSDNSGKGANIAPGAPATFIAVKGGPEELPESLNDVRGVWNKGKRLF